MKKLVGEGVGASSIEVTDGNIKSFERVASKYNVDFAVKKDKTTEPPKYVVFFKGRDADAVAQAFKEFVYGNEKKNGQDFRKGETESISGMQYHKDKNRERSREKNKDRGQSLMSNIIDRHYQRPESYPEKAEGKSRRCGYQEADAFESALYPCRIFL